MKKAFIILFSLIACVALNGNYVETNEPVPLPEKDDVRVGADAASIGTDIPDTELQKQETESIKIEESSKKMRKKHGLHQERTFNKSPRN